MVGVHVWSGEGFKYQADYWILCTVKDADIKFDQKYSNDKFWQLNKLILVYVSLQM